jgi:hypothetical protein
LKGRTRSHWAARLELAFLVAVPCVIVVVVVGYATGYDLVAPRSGYNDTNYYYVLAAPSVFEGPDLPRFEHPGANVMLALAWYFHGLHAIGLLPAVSLSDLRESADPFRDMSRLLLAGKLFALAVAAVYLALIYAVGKRVTGSRLVSGLCVLYCVAVVGVVEQMFIVRPEPLAAVLFLGALLLCLGAHGHGGAGRLLPRVALVAFLVAASVMAKLLAVLFLPLLAPAVLRWLRSDLGLTRRRYLTCLGALLAVDGLVVAPWLPLVSSHYLQAYRGVASFGVAASIYQKILLGMVVAAVIATAAAVVSVFGSALSRRVRSLRAACLIGLAATAGVASSLYVFCLSGADSRLEWARRVVFRALGETIGLMAMGATAERPLSLSVPFVVNAEIRHLLTGMLGATAVCVIGFWYATARDRRRLIALAAFLYGLSVAMTMRGHADFIFYYQVLVLVVVSLAVMIAGRNLGAVLRAGRSGVAVACVVGLAVAGDAWSAATYREQMFPRRLDAAAEMSILDYLGNGIFVRTVLEPPYCDRGLPRTACYRVLGRYLSAEQDRWDGWRRQPFRRTGG